MNALMLVASFAVASADMMMLTETFSKEGCKSGDVTLQAYTKRTCTQDEACKAVGATWTKVTCKPKVGTYTLAVHDDKDCKKTPTTLGPFVWNVCQATLTGSTKTVKKGSDLVTKTYATKKDCSGTSTDVVIVKKAFDKKCEKQDVTNTIGATTINGKYVKVTFRNDKDAIVDGAMAASLSGTVIVGLAATVLASFV